MYARSDITQLARGNAYNRLQWEEVTVGQALALAQLAAPAWPAQPGAQARPSAWLGRAQGPLEGMSSHADSSTLRDR